ncbi:hypothetical protein D1872_263230 [compost metagenome]
MKKEYIVFSQKLAGFLMMNNFVLKRMGKSDKNSDLNIFFFNENDELLSKINEFKLIYKK